MRPDVAKSKEESDVFLAEIKAIIAQYLIQVAPVHEDVHHNADLMVIEKPDGTRIACRVRGCGYWDRYRDEFTIRTNRPSGAETELAKILAGWGDYFFYGFGCQRSRRLHAWLFGRLAVFRDWYTSGAGDLQHNRDHSSDFRAFHLADLPAAFLLGRLERDGGCMEHGLAKVHEFIDRCHCDRTLEGLSPVSEKDRDRPCEGCGRPINPTKPKLIPA